jgi:integrase
VILLSKMTDDDLAWLLSFESGRAFYNAKMKNSAVTQKTYTRWLNVYCEDLGLTPDQLILLKPNMDDVMRAFQKGEVIPECNKADKVLEDYLSFTMNEFNLRNPKHPKATDSNKLNVMITIRSFYSANLRDLAKQTGKNIEKLKSKQRTPTVEDCVKLEKAMGNNARNAFLLWFLESCPVRVGTLKKLTWKDLKPLNDSEVPYWISIESARLKGSGKGRYSKAKHIGFLHKYAVQKLEDYKKELKQKGIEYNQDSPLFMSYHINQHGAEKGTRMVNFNDAFSNAAIVAFGDDETKYYSPHDFRDLLSSVLGKPQINAEDKNIAKALVSHSAKGIESTYDLNSALLRHRYVV